MCFLYVPLSYKRILCNLFKIIKKKEEQNTFFYQHLIKYEIIAYKCCSIDFQHPALVSRYAFPYGVVIYFRPCFDFM